jgi:hypothetical protein
MGTDRKAAVTNRVEGVFQVVGECGERVKTEHRAGTLYGVQRAEGASDKVQVSGIFVEGQERGLKLDQDFASFFLEGLLVFIEGGVFGQRNTPQCL